MILQALSEYYVRKVEFCQNTIAGEGFESKEIPFLIEFDKDGNFIDFIDTRSPQGKKMIGKSYFVPSLPVGVKRVGTKIVPNLLWDSCDYALGISLKVGEEKNPNAEKLLSFCDEIKRFNDFVHDSRLDALLKFLESDPIKAIESKKGSSECWETLQSSEKIIIGFSYVDDPFTPLTDSLAAKITAYRELSKNDKENVRVCLVTGETTEVARLHAPIPKWGGGMASLVSFQKKSGYDSYGQEQALNAPVSKKITSQYLKALDLLLNRQDYSNCRIGKTTVCFWSRKEDSILEKNFGNLFWEVKDNPDKNALGLKKIFQSVKNATFACEINNKFYVLGLEPLSKGRAAIRFWHADSYVEIQRKIKSYFNDIAIDSEDNVFPLNMYLRALVMETGMPPKRTLDDLPPNLAGDLMRSIMENLPFPQRILNLAINRIRSECSRNKEEKKRDQLNKIDCCRIALLKACLNRKKNIQEKEITMSLDLTNENIGYRLGRLFAAFEKLQEDAQPGINATIRDRYYGAASSTPCTVFPQLFKLKNHHLAKLSNIGQKVNYEKLIGEITSAIPADGMPAHLNLDDQSRFAIGYYHQRQDFFKTNKSEK